MTPEGSLRFRFPRLANRNGAFVSKGERSACRFEAGQPRERGEGENPGEGGGSQKELGKGPGVVDLQRCWGFPEQSYKGRI